MSAPHRLPFSGALLLTACAFLLSACNSSAEPTTAREHFEQLVGDWEGTHRLHENPNEYAALYSISLDGEVLVHSFSSAWEGGFTGHERMTIKEDGTLVATWSDSGGDENLVTRGTWSGETRTLEMKGEGVSWSNPQKAVQYRHVTTYADDSFLYTMHLTQDGEEQEVMWIEMRRKSAE
ncbi:MAG: DUF1579 domain-containing protein [Planctomycetes bacterium]|nr:DUF1579 domain-containing protein [Planctomycetota bacterium]